MQTVSSERNSPAAITIATTDIDSTHPANFSTFFDETSPVCTTEGKDGTTRTLRWDGAFGSSESNSSGVKTSQTATTLRWSVSDCLGAAHVWSELGCGASAYYYYFEGFL